MNTKRIFLYMGFLALGVTLYSCNNNEQAKGNTENASVDLTTVFHDSLAKAEEALVGNDFAFDANFYKHYEGTIAGKHVITAEIIKIGDKVRGYYQYDTHGVPLSLTEGTVKENGAFKIQETDYLYNITGTWIAAFKGENIEGVWVSPDKSKRLTLSLKEVVANNSLPCIVEYQERVTLLKGNDAEKSPKYTFIYSSVYPAPNYQNTSPQAILVAGFFDRLFGKNAVKGHPSQSIDAIYAAASAQYRQQNREFADSTDMAYALNWSDVLHFDVIYNAHGIFSGSALIYNYTGGAHGNYGRSLYVLDVTSGKQLTAIDVFKSGSQRGMKALLMREIRKIDGLAADASLQENGYSEDEIKVGENFYATNKGLGFYFSPYEIAPYARGGVELFIPYQDCLPYLNPNSLLAKFAQAQ